ncbi:NADH:flavin oxidoreductase/NADH oxidase-like protein [Hypoxylon sp. FL1284]|nr:NADH:flavin oxidoreductase/NADH oxidase-like protein [Hypoxylon sp. FL1284]
MPVARYESAPTNVEPLGRPLKFEHSGRVAKNRFFKAAMAEELASWSPRNLEERGIPTKETIELYRRWGEGGWGVILTGNMDIEFDMLDAVGDGIITPECPPSGPRFEAFRELATAAKAHGSLILAQMTHPGRQLSAHIRKDTIAPSVIQHPPKSVLGSEYAVPREMTAADIARVIDGFAHAAAYLQAAGFDGMELHGAHGYLLAQFLSPLTNQRTDEYGSTTIQNRTRFVAEIARAIRRRVGRAGFVLGVKLNSVEFQAGGVTPADAAALCSALQAADLGLDFVELSGGNHEVLGYGSPRESTLRREAFFLEFVRDVAPRLSTTRSYLTGGFRTAAAMVDALRLLDGVGVGRPAAQEPRFAADVLAGRVTGAVRPRDDVLDRFVMHLFAGGTQMRQVAKGREPFDLSDPAAVATFAADAERQFARRAADGDKLEVYGFADLTAPEVNSHPYGVPY